MEYLANADAEHRPETNHVAINWQGRGLVTLVLEALGHRPGRWEGVTLGRMLADGLASTLENSPALGSGGQRLAEAIRMALERDPVLVLAEEGPHIQNAGELLVEEIFHRAQYHAAGSDAIIELTTADSNRLCLHPASVKAVRYVEREDGASYGPQELAFKIPAKLVRGASFWLRAGISPTEAPRPWIFTSRSLSANMESRRRIAYEAPQRSYFVVSKDRQAHFQINRRQPLLKGLKELADKVKVVKVPLAKSKAPENNDEPTPSRRSA